MMPEFFVSCKENIYSEDYYDLLIPYGVKNEVPGPSECVQRITEGIDILYYPTEGLPPLSVREYTYTAIPKCYGLANDGALADSGITKLMENQSLSLSGGGVMIGFIDTGIDYTNPIFRYNDGSSRIAAIWDQTITDGIPPEGILYGAEYDKAAIDEALLSSDPYAKVPSRDMDGHGTFLAGVACGGEDIGRQFIGAAPYSTIAVVKLKGAKYNIREYFHIKKDAAAFAETDIMMGISYLDALANEMGMPLVICLGLESSAGSHGRTGVMTAYIDTVCTRRGRAVIAPAGNEANARHHYSGELGILIAGVSGDASGYAYGSTASGSAASGNGASDGTLYDEVEINVESDSAGFTAELWSRYPSLASVSVISPSGEELPKVPLRGGSSGEYSFLLEKTVVSIDYRIEAKETASQLIFMRFGNVGRGIWKVRVYPESDIGGKYDIWLPINAFLDVPIYFLRPDPDMTVTSPGNIPGVITAGGYKNQNNSIYAESGRGYTASGYIKPDFAAPAVDIAGPDLRGNIISMTGTSAAAAITAGAVADLMQWAIVEKNAPALSSEAIKAKLIRGAHRKTGLIYPNREWGYGALDAYGALVSETR
jgi:hypothetical protein